jgi:hypothetical protein
MANTRTVSLDQAMLSGEGTLIDDEGGYCQIQREPDSQQFKDREHERLAKTDVFSRLSFNGRAMATCRKFGLRYFLPQRNNFRHLLPQSLLRNKRKIEDSSLSRFQTHAGVNAQS